MSNLTRLASRPAGPGQAAPQGYRVVGILIATMAILVGWGQIGNSAAAWPAPANMARAATSTYNYPLYAWGYNYSGQLGNGTNSYSSTPVAVNLPAGVVPTAIAAGTQYNLTIGSDGKLYAWGDNQYGELGNGTTTNSSTPVTISLPGGVTPTAIAANVDRSLAIGSNGKLYSWGVGYLGNGTTTGSSSPVTVSLPAGVVPRAIAEGYDYSLAIGSDDNLYGWGLNDFGQLGNRPTSSSVPVTVSLPAGITLTNIATGVHHNLAIGSDGNLYAWGVNNAGQLGNGTTSAANPNPTPMLVNLPAGALPTVIAAGASYSLAIGNNGKLYAWGANNGGQLGNGTNVNSSIPITVSLPAGVTPIAIAAGYYHTLAVGSDGKLYAWGYNSDGEFGNGTTTSSYTPVLVGSVMAGIAHPLLAAGQAYSLGVLALPSRLAANGGNSQSATVGTAFATPLVARVQDFANNPVSSATVIFSAPASGASGTFAGGSPVYTGTTDASGLVTATTFMANTSVGSYSITATVSRVITPATFSLTNLACSSLNVTSVQDDGSCATLRVALGVASSSPTKTVTISLSAGSTISLTSGLTLSSGVAITTTAPCGIGAGNTMLPPVIIQGVGANSGVGLTLAGHNQLYGLWVRGFSGVQIKAPPGSSTKMQCVRASKS